MSSPFTETLIVGAGISGLGFRGFWKDCWRDAGGAGSVVVVDKASEPGGWCRTVKQDGFVWDYSGHFFHFRHKDLEQRLVSRLPAESVRTIVRRSRVVDVDGCEVSFPYQRAIGELPGPAFKRCLVDLWNAEQTTTTTTTSFKEMLFQRLGRGIGERFLVPYNEKLYATDLDALDAECMGRFFPTTTFADVMKALAGSNDDAGYNATFTYPRGGAVEYVNALAQDLGPGELALNETVTAIDLKTKTATLVSSSSSSSRSIRFDRLITSAPLPQTLQACGMEHDGGAFSGNRVLVFNLGFDAKGRDDAHWIYFAQPALPFYRVGFYDNIFGDDRMSLYVEIGLPASGAIDVDLWKNRVLKGLVDAGVVTQQKLVSWHAVLMDPAYVHITAKSLSETARTRAALEAAGVFSIGRYGGWTYCSIEDNLVEARALAQRLAQRLSAR
ncbi:MAG: FAD-dependent oxidoreductase [Deltaproteobacteria bacterium]|nr:FAD-dependent oxidoreductase [Deltaproteobacteria bacterium]